jgi:Fic family protein
MTYNWQKTDWPNFKFDFKEIENDLFLFTEASGQIVGLSKAIPENIQTESLLQFMVSEALKTSEIENEYYSREDIYSSIRNNLSLDTTKLKVKDLRAEGISKLVIEGRKTYKDDISMSILLDWHRTLFPSRTDISTGSWRKHKDPMRIVSGVLGRETIHFEAPPSSDIPQLMEAFIKWFNDTSPDGNQMIRHAPIRASIAHLYFESIHPFEDGNGRIGRLLADKALSQSLGYPVLLSLSTELETNKKEYYNALKIAQRNNEITPWIKYFTGVLINAQTNTEVIIQFTLKKAKIFDEFKEQLNHRQTKCIQRMFEAGPRGFIGGMSAKKYMSLSKTSKATATRDLQVLENLGILESYGGGRSTHYQLKI